METSSFLSDCVRKTALSASEISCSFTLAVFKDASSFIWRSLSSLILVCASVINLESILYFLSLIKFFSFSIISVTLESKLISWYKLSTSLSRTVLSSLEAKSFFSFSIIFSSAITSPSSLPSSLTRSSLRFWTASNPDSSSITFFASLDSLESLSRSSLRGFLSARSASREDEM